MNNTLNLVYDSWDNEEMLPNLVSTTKTNSFRTVTGLFNFYEVLDNVKNCKIEDVYNNPNEKYFYFINPIGNSLSLFHQFKHVPIPDIVIECFKKCENFNIVILNEHEPETKEYLKFVNDDCDLKGCDKKRFYILNNNAKLLEYKKDLGTDINVYSTEFLLKFIAKHLCRQDSKFVTEKGDNQFFMCHNRSPKVHRYVLLCLLMESGIIENIDWSMVMGWYRKNHKSGGFYETLLNKFEIYFKYYEYIQFLDNIEVKKSKFEVDKDWFTAEEIAPNFEWNQIYELKTYESSYVNIVTESNFIFDEIHITEKSLKPFYFYQFPIFLSSKNHVKWLKEKFSFDMFDEVIDHSYDNESDNKKRLFMVFDEIKKLNENKNKLIEFYKNNESRFEKNKQIVIEISKNMGDIEYFDNMCKKL
jgi:hypothetical protein